jgi:hypothetical protein
LDLRTASGIDQLRKILVESVVGQIARLRDANLHRVCLRVLDALEVGERAVTEAGPALLEELRQRQAALADLQAASAKWPRQTAEAFVDLQRDVVRRQRRCLEELAQRYDDHGLKSFLGRPEALRAALLQELASIEAELNEEVVTGITDIADMLATTVAQAGLAITGEELAAQTPSMLDSLLTGGPGRLEEGQRVRTVRLAYGALSQGLSFNSLGHLGFLATLGISSAMFPAGLAFGGMLALLEVRHLRHQSRLQELRPYVQQAVRLGQSELGDSISARLTATQRSLESVLRDRLAEAQRELLSARDRVQLQAQRAGTEEGRQAVALAKTKLEQLTALRKACQGELNALSDATTPVSPTPTSTVEGAEKCPRPTPTLPLSRTQAS